VFIPVQHHAVNYPVAYYGAFVPNLPSKLYDDPRVPHQEFGFDRLPQAHVATVRLSNNDISNNDNNKNNNSNKNNNNSKNSNRKTTCRLNNNVYYSINIHNSLCVA
jgi:hypothetical protein